MAGASAFRILFTVTFPLIAPAIISGMLLSFIVMLGIYGIPAVLGAPANIPVLTTYIFKLTNWSPPLYSTAAAVAIILMVVTGASCAAAEGAVAGAATSRWPARRSARAARSRAMALFHPRARDRLSCHRGGAAGLALIVAAFRKFLFIRNVARLFDQRQYWLMHFDSLFDNPLAMRSIVNTMEVGLITALVGGVLAFAIGYTVTRQRARPPRHRRDLDDAGRDPRPGHRRRLSVGMDRPARRALRHDLDSGARLHRALHARHHQGAVHLAAADPQGAGGSLLDLRQGAARHHPPSCCRSRAPA